MPDARKTVAYYDRNAEAFVSGTLSADMSEARSQFTSLLPANARILDFGCGSGRDTKAFLEAGYRAEATDGSHALCEIASAYTGIPVVQADFRDLDAVERYDGIWACASLLHLPRADLQDVLRKTEKALKPGGILYLSFKYGSFEGIRNGRYFTDLTESSLDALLQTVPSLQKVLLWCTRDVRPDREDTEWLNALLRRIPSPDASP